MLILSGALLCNMGFGEISYYTIKDPCLSTSPVVQLILYKSAITLTCCVLQQINLRTTSSSWLGYPMYSDRQVSRLIEIGIGQVRITVTSSCRTYTCFPFHLQSINFLRYTTADTFRFMYFSTHIIAHLM